MEILPIRDLDRIFVPCHEIDYMLISLYLMGFSFHSYVNQLSFDFMSVNYHVRFKISRSWKLY